MGPRGSNASESDLALLLGAGKQLEEKEAVVTDQKQFLVRF